MSDTRTITLAGQPIEVPMLPLRLNMKAYPLCQRYNTKEFWERVKEAKGSLQCSEEEMADLAELAFIAAKAADPTLERDAFDGWAITPPELLDCFFHVRYQTGGWTELTPEQAAALEASDEPGEAQGA